MIQTTTEPPAEGVARCPNCRARVIRPASEGGGTILKARWLWSKPDGSTVVACYQCGAELGLRRGPTPLLFRRAPATSARKST